MAEEWNPKADADWQKKLEKYPSLRKLDELGDDYTEVESAGTPSTVKAD